MNKNILIIIIMILNLLNPFMAKSQTTTNYWYEGYVYQEKAKGCHFLTVVLTEQGNETPKAITMSSPAGLISFKGVPINIYKNHILSVYQGAQLLGRYIRKGFDKKPSFVGNLNTHILIERAISLSTRILKTGEEQKKVFLGDFLVKNEMEIEASIIFPKDTDKPFRVFVNGMELEQAELQSLLEKASMELVKHIEVLRYDTPNPYFSGGLNIVLNVGEQAFFPANQSFNPLERYIK